jgi:hypothetical protein
MNRLLLTSQSLAAGVRQQRTSYRPAAPSMSCIFGAWFGTFGTGKGPRARRPAPLGLLKSGLTMPNGFLTWTFYGRGLNTLAFDITPTRILKRWTARPVAMKIGLNSNTGGSGRFLTS